MGGMQQGERRGADCEQGKMRGESRVGREEGKRKEAG